MRRERRASPLAAAGVRFSDVAAGDVDRLARAGAGGGVSLGEAREGVLTGVREGLSSQVIAQMDEQAKRLAATLGKELPDAQKLLAAALREGAGGAQDLYSKFGLLDAASVQHIKLVQQEQGVEAARLETLRLLPKSSGVSGRRHDVLGPVMGNL
jgi:hypothetical protein